MSVEPLATIANATNEVLKALTERLYSGQINLVQWSLGVAGELKDAHVASALVGTGSNSLNLQQLARVGGTLADEYRHLFDFAVGIARGDVSEAQALARISQYGKASQQEYWREYAKAQEKVDAWAALPILSQSPGDGKTRCRGNCNCTLSSKEDGIHWEINPGESCEDCEALAAGGPYRPR
jgi:hypothetical protein